MSQPRGSPFFSWSPRNRLLHNYRDTTANPAERRKKYYSNVNISDLDDDPYTRDDSLPTGGALVDEILGVYQSAPVMQTLALTTIGPLLMEPPPPRDVPLFERLLESIVVQALEVLSGHLVNGFTRSVQALAANPGGIAAAAGEVGGTLADAAGTVKSKLPGPAQRGIDAAGRAGQRIGKAAAPAVAAMRDVMSPMSPSPELLDGLAQAGRMTLGAVDAKGRAVHLVNDFKTTAIGAVGARASADGAAVGPVAFAFLATMGSQIEAYTKAVVSRSPKLRALLETLPPDALTRLRDQQDASLGGAYAAMRTTIAERWTTVIATAHAGQDADGTTAHAGTLEDASRLPGVLQFRARLEASDLPFGGSAPKLTLRAPPVLNGISASMMAVLRESGRPLHLVNMQRTLEVEFGGDSMVLSLGTIDFGPDGQVDLSRADIHSLSMIARGEVPDRAHSKLEHAMATSAGLASPAAATAAAHALLKSLGLTTKDL